MRDKTPSPTDNEITLRRAFQRTSIVNIMLHNRICSKHTYVDCKRASSQINLIKDIRSHLTTKNLSQLLTINKEGITQR